VFFLSQVRRYTLIARLLGEMGRVIAHVSAQRRISFRNYSASMKAYQKSTNFVKKMCKNADICSIFQQKFRIFTLLSKRLNSY